MISIENMTAYYEKDNPVLHGISLEMPDNRNVCIIGNNGSGKTTLLRSICGLISYDGNVCIDGADIRKMKRREIASRVALMSQFNDIYFSYSVYDTVMLGRYVHTGNHLGIPDHYDRDTVEECLETTGIADLKDRSITELSGGQLQRVMLARTYAQGSHIILLDEPANHLDLNYQNEMIRYLKNWSDKDGNMIIGVFHDINMASEIADDMILMKDGQTAASGTKESMLDGEILKSVYGMDVVKYMQDMYSRWAGIV